MIRYATGRVTLFDMERQAEENLRHSFAVVGLVEEVDTFYEMLAARVQYMNMSLNPDAIGTKHSTGSKGEVLRCKKQCRDPDFHTRSRR